MRKVFASFAFVGLLAMAGAAYADQCAWLKPAWAKKSKTFLVKGYRYLLKCEPCGEKKHTGPFTIEEVHYKRLPAYLATSINGRPVDLAYLFVESPRQPGVFHNAAKLSGCPAQDVSPKIVLKKKAKGKQKK
jgi:hypothetical protein